MTERGEGPDTDDTGRDDRGTAARPAPGDERVLIAGSPDVLLVVAAALAADPETTVVSVSPPGPRGPERIVAAVPPRRLADLREAFGDAVLIEPDEPLRPLGP